MCLVFLSNKTSHRRVSVYAVLVHVNVSVSPTMVLRYPLCVHQMLFNNVFLSICIISAA